MVEWHLIILLIALILDWFMGDPEPLWSRIPHPVVLFGKVIGFLDLNLNGSQFADKQLKKRGGIAIGTAILTAIFAANFVSWILSWFSPIGWIGEVMIVAVLIAQKSLGDHVSAVALALKEDGLDAARAEVSKIVGRDPEQLDESGVARAAIESLAENFSDGVVAPVFWYAIFGLPGLFVYKMINTADSMIAHKNEKYLHFGYWTAHIDDWANWVPARLSMVVIALGALAKGQINQASAAIETAVADARLHASPNAGWPEAAMAGAVGVSLGGSRIYNNKLVEQEAINAKGKQRLDADDINRTLDLFARSCFALWALVIAAAFAF